MTSPGPDPSGPGAPYGGPPQLPLPEPQPYGQQPYGQQPYGPPSAYGYGDPPPAYGTQYGGAQYGGPQYGPGFPPPYAPVPMTPPGLVIVPGHPPMEAATPGQRSLARLIDSIGYLLLIGLAVLVLWLILRDATSFSYSYEYGYPSQRSGDLAFLWVYPVIAGVWLIIVGYESLMIGLTGATLGGRLAGVRFVNVNTGERPGFGRGLGRAAMLGASVVVCYGLVFLLLLFSMFFDGGTGRYQSWVDKIFSLQAVSTRG